MLNKIKTILSVLSIAFCFLVPNLLLAQDQTQAPTPYTLLAPLPFISANCPNGIGQNCTTTGASYIPGVIQLAIAIAGVLAVVRIMWGGFQYISSDSFGSKSNAKGIINDALWGLMLTLSAYLILNTLNPALVNFNLNIPQQTIVTTPLPGGGTTGGGASYDTVKNALAPGVVPYAPQCQNGATTSCVDLAGIQPQTISGLKALAQACNNCGTIEISGGTEGGHSTGSAHNNGTAVDILPNVPLNKLVIGSSKQLGACQTYTNSNFSGKFLWEPKGSTCGGDVASSNDHWHISY